tara:strand:+ start:2519 stop:2899 length:381 start_codon:yes stop_codon:yes gene_type:complete
MANELTVSVSLTYNKPVAVIGATNLAVDLTRATTRQLDITTGRKVELSQVIGTTEETLALVDVANPRYIYIQNLDETNSVQVGTAAGAYSIKLLPGDITLFPPNAAALYLKADTADCLVSIAAVNA